MSSSNNSTTTTSNSVNKTSWNAFLHAVMKESQRTIALVIHEHARADCDSMKASQRYDLFFNMCHGKENDVDFISEIKKLKQRRDRHSLLLEEKENTVASNQAATDGTKQLAINHEVHC